MGQSRHLFLNFRLFYLNVQLVDKILPVLGFEPRIFGVGRDRSTHWAITTALIIGSFKNRERSRDVPASKFHLDGITERGRAHFLLPCHVREIFLLFSNSLKKSFSKFVERKNYWEWRHRCHRVTNLPVLAFTPRDTTTVLLSWTLFKVCHRPGGSFIYWVSRYSSLAWNAGTIWLCTSHMH